MGALKEGLPDYEAGYDIPIALTHQIYMLILMLDETAEDDIQRAYIDTEAGEQLLQRIQRLRMLAFDLYPHIIAGERQRKLQN